MVLDFQIERDHEKIAQLFNLTYSELSRLIYPTTNNCYKSFFIPKKSGGHREINSPKSELLRIQQKLAKEFENIYSPKDSTHGFVSKRSIVTNAVRHTNKKFVFNIDLEDFFGSIHFVRVRNLLISSPFKSLEASWLLSPEETVPPFSASFTTLLLTVLSLVTNSGSVTCFSP